MSISTPQISGIPGRVFKAKFPSKCGLCPRRIFAGDRICYIADRTVAHEACAARDSPITAEQLADDRARANMRSHKPSTYRLGRSPSSYG